jgi:hypothetical protein
MLSPQSVCTASARARNRTREIRACACNVCKHIACARIGARVRLVRIYMTRDRSPSPASHWRPLLIRALTIRSKHQHGHPKRLLPCDRHSSIDCHRIVCKRCAGDALGLSRFCLRRNFDFHCQIEQHSSGSPRDDTRGPWTSRALTWIRYILLSTSSFYWTSMPT